MVRKEWVNLNGLWDYAITPKDGALAKWDEKILVPSASKAHFPASAKPSAQTTDSGIGCVTDKLAPIDGKRWLLNFGAVDWHAIVSVNGKQVGEHKGGYDPFSIDITEALKKDGPQEIT